MSEEKSWLRKKVESRTRPTVAMGERVGPWAPGVIDKVAPEVLSALTYVVLDEREADGDLSFVLTPWPEIDRLGRVRHRREHTVGVSVDAREWLVLLRARRVPESLRERAPVIGDAFAMMLARRDARSLLAPVGPVVDVTEDARDAARAAFYGAVAAPLTPDVADAVAAPKPESERPGHVAEPEEWTAHVRTAVAT